MMRAGGYSFDLYTLEHLKETYSYFDRPYPKGISLVFFLGDMVRSSGLPLSYQSHQEMVLHLREARLSYSDFLKIIQKLLLREFECVLCDEDPKNREIIDAQYTHLLPLGGNTPSDDNSKDSQDAFTANLRARKKKHTSPKSIDGGMRSETKTVQDMIARNPSILSWNPDIATAAQQDPYRQQKYKLLRKLSHEVRERDKLEKNWGVSNFTNQPYLWEDIEPILHKRSNPCAELLECFESLDYANRGKIVNSDVAHCTARICERIPEAVIDWMYRKENISSNQKYLEFHEFKRLFFLWEEGM